MSKPRGERFNIIWSRAPWKSVDSCESVQQPERVHCSSQEERDICLNCEEPICRGDCKKFSEKKRKLIIKEKNDFYSLYNNIPDDVYSKFKAGMRSVDIAKEYNVSPDVVHRWKKKLGLVSQMSERVHVDFDEFKEAVKKGYPKRKLKVTFGIGQERVNDLIEQLGLASSYKK